MGIWRGASMLDGTSVLQEDQSAFLASEGGSNRMNFSRVSGHTPSAIKNHSGTFAHQLEACWG
jgi:hypothetical protein